MKHLSLFLACAACFVGSAAEAPSDATFADLAVAEKRLGAQQAIFDHARNSDVFTSIPASAAIL